MRSQLKTSALSIALVGALAGVTCVTEASAQTATATPPAARPVPATDASLVPPDMSSRTGTQATPVTQAASSLVLLPARSKRVLVPRTGSAVPSGISGVSGSSNQSAGRSNGINDGADPSRGSGGAGGGIGTSALGSRPLSPRDDMRPSRP